MDIALLLLALLGHMALWVAVINRSHAIGWRRPVVMRVTSVLAILLLAPPLALAGWVVCVLWTGGNPRDDWSVVEWSRPGPLALAAYLAACGMFAVLTAAQWVARLVWHRPPHLLRFHRTRRMDIRTLAPSSQESPQHFLVRLSGNEILSLDVTERAIDVPRLPSALDGLVVAHLSDFHFTGRVPLDYFQEVVRHSNELLPDLVAITGDLVDRPACIDWIPETLGRLRARHGVYFVLGNHDARVDLRRLLAVLGECGLVHLGGRWIETAVRGQRLVLAGSERPWLPGAADLGNCPPRTGGPPRILLAHTPDQLAWARQSDADLLLAGHIHGGQIRLPLLGPIFSPSRLGVTYASGLFYAPPTILHVSRGVSGEVPVRLNCPPEITLLRLYAGGEAAVDEPSQRPADRR
jgi:predicted MPP superfamily phosphohydrolase